MNLGNLTELFDKDVAAGVLACFGGIVRILLNVDGSISTWKQFVLLFVCSLPSGWLAYTTAVGYGLDAAAFPLGFITGMMALSMATIVVRDGATALFLMLTGRGK